MTFYLHHVPGRLRIQAQRFKANDAAAAAVGTAMMIAGVSAAHANPRTGSLLIHYDPTHLRPERLWQALSERDLVACEARFGDGAGVTRIELPATGKGENGLLAALAALAAEKLVERMALTVIAAII